MRFRFSVLQTEVFHGYGYGEYGDPLTIYDGSTDQSTQIAKLSGNLGSFNVSSNGNSLFVKFEADKAAVKDGFFATIHYGNPYFNIK